MAYRRTGKPSEAFDKNIKGGIDLEGHEGRTGVKMKSKEYVDYLEWRIEGTF